MNVFITGATGLVGSFVCRELLQLGHTVRAAKRASSKMMLSEDIQDQIEWIVGDMDDTIFLEDALNGNRGCNTGCGHYFF